MGAVASGHRVRPPAVAGRFYPEDPEELRAAVDRYLADAPPSDGDPPVGVIAPHAGYPYSGPVAGSAYALVAAAEGGFRRVVLVGPSHFVAFRGVALPESDAFATPLGEHPIDGYGMEILASEPLARPWAAPHRDEHSLEVQLPFLTVTLGPLPILPMLTGSASPDEVAGILERVWGPDTLLVVSSDLSHFLPADSARRVDQRTARAIEALDVDEIGPEDACGATALSGLLALARRRSLEVKCVDLRTSGDTQPSAGRRRVVGYGAFGVWSETPGH